MKFEDMFEVNEAPPHWHATDPDGGEVVKLASPGSRVVWKSVVIVKDGGVWRPISWSKKSAAYFNQDGGYPNAHLASIRSRHGVSDLEFTVVPVELRSQHNAKNPADLNPKADPELSTARYWWAEMPDGGAVKKAIPTGSKATYQSAIAAHDGTGWWVVQWSKKPVGHLQPLPGGGANPAVSTARSQNGVSHLPFAVVPVTMYEKTVNEK